jgi:hypothetical protein
MPRYRNTTGQVLISLDFGVIGPNELVAEHYDPAVHGVIPGCTRVDDETDADGTPSAAPDDDSGAGIPPDPLPRRRGKAAGQDKETAE